MKSKRAKQPTTNIIGIKPQNFTENTQRKKKKEKQTTKQRVRRVKLSGEANQRENIEIQSQICEEDRYECTAHSDSVLVCIVIVLVRALGSTNGIWNLLKNSRNLCKNAPSLSFAHHRIYCDCTCGGACLFFAVAFGRTHFHCNIRKRSINFT